MRIARSHGTFCAGGATIEKATACQTWHPVFRIIQPTRHVIQEQSFRWLSTPPTFSLNGVLHAARRSIRDAQCRYHLTVDGFPPAVREACRMELESHRTCTLCKTLIEARDCMANSPANTNAGSITNNVSPAYHILDVSKHLRIYISMEQPACLPSIPSRPLSPHSSISSSPTTSLSTLSLLILFFPPPPQPPSPTPISHCMPPQSLTTIRTLSGTLPTLRLAVYSAYIPDVEIHAL